MQKFHAISRKHWIWALSLAVLFHMALFVGFAMTPNESLPVKSSTQAITIALAPKAIPEPVAKTKPAPKPKPKSKPIAKPKPKSKPAPSPKPQPKSKSLPKPKPAPTPSPSPSPKPEPAVASKPPTPSDQRKTQAARSEQPAPTAQSNITGSLRDTPPDYRATLGAWLARHKHYPRRARRLGQQGTAVLHFVIDRKGKVLEWSISSSSGHQLLDDAVKQMIRQSDPLPAMPDSMAVSKLELTVPINFALQ